MALEARDGSGEIALEVFRQTGLDLGFVGGQQKTQSRLEPDPIVKDLQDTGQSAALEAEGIALPIGIDPKFLAHFICKPLSDRTGTIQPDLVRTFEHNVSQDLLRSAREAGS